MPPLSGFWSKDEILSQAFLRDDYGLWVVGIIAAAFTAFYMTRLIFLMFYGNARYEALPVISGGSGEDEPVDATVATTADADDDSDPSPTVSYGDPVPAPSGHPPHESPPIMVLPVMVLAVLAAIGGIMNLPFTSIESSTSGSSRRSAAFPRSIPTPSSVAWVWRCSRSPSRSAAFCSPTRSTEAASRVPTAIHWTSGSVRSRPVLGNAYYYDHGIAKLVDGPGRATASWLDRVVDTKIIDGAVNGVGSLFATLSRGIATAAGRTASAATRSAVSVGTVAALLYVVIWLGR